MTLADYGPILLFGGLVSLFAVGSLVASTLLAPNMPTPAKLEPYECGITPGDIEEVASQRFPVKFYVVAMLFIVFDIETVFLFPWAVIFKRLGIAGLVEMGVFIAFLLGAFIYVWRRGGLEWE